jgi:alpha-L-fucosidase
MKMISIIFCLSLWLCSRSQSASGPTPSEKQLAWHDNPFYLFMHFGPNTFTDLEWGKGSEKEEVFNPTALDCRQWCRIAKAAGASGIIITAKHHDGFCLWPSEYSHHTVAQSSWRSGKGDVLKELSDACREAGLAMGVYLSPWDRNHPAYGTPAYNEVFIHMMEEVVRKYGPFFEFWWDGANGEGPNGKIQVYDWHGFESTIRRIAPNTVVFSDIGPDIRWAGNEKGIAGTTNWNLLDTAGFSRGRGAPPNDTLNQGNVNGKNWIPEECDVSIRPGWFYHSTEDSLVKTPEKLFDIYLKSVGRGANLILNVPPDRRGLIAAQDSAALMGFARLRLESFINNLIVNENAVIFYSGKNITGILGNGQGDFELGSLYKKEYLEILFNRPVAVNCIFLKEAVARGQQIKSFSIELYKGDSLLVKTAHSTIGHHRLVSFPKQYADRILIRITDAKSLPVLNGLGVYNIPEKLVENLKN